MRLRGRHYATGETVEIVCANGVIDSVGPPTAARADLEAGWIAPALFDLQINGCDGHSFNSERLNPDSVRQVVAVCRRHGIAALLPTLVTNSFAALRHGLATLHAACEEDRTLAAALPGIHLEGPYISPEDGPRGAHPRQHVRPPNWDEFSWLQAAAGGRIRLVTLAPEQDGALSFIERLVCSGVVVALGHTAASPECIRDAVRAGARLSTHLGNGCHAVLPRHDNYLWEQLAADDLWASLICDGHHLPVAVVRCLLRVKTPARSILTCDASSLAGLPPGRYVEWGQDFEVQPGGKVVVPGTTYLAGSGIFTDACLDFVLRHTEVSLADALEMAGARPRQLLRLPARRLEPGLPADLVLFEHGPEEPFRVVATIVAGALVS
jgi:N-acetylglucosamine-6-phosphate deacetylase